MLHKPTQRKLPKKYEQSDQQDLQQVKKAASKPIINRAATNAVVSRSNQRQASVQGRVTKVEQKIQNMAGKLTNAQLQNILISEIKGIKNQLKEIKQQIGIQKSEQKKPQYLQQQLEEPEQEENIYNVQKVRQQQHFEKQQEIENESVAQNRNFKQIQNQSRHHQQSAKFNSNYKLSQKPKQLVQVGKIQPYMKQFKIEVSKNIMPYYHGYHKKSSKPVIIKYCPQNKSMEPIFNLYQRLWKNIVKAKSICINKVYDINQPLATYILVIEANKYSLAEILETRTATVSQIMCTLVRALQFFHECGYLYRNMHPLHVMYSFDNEIVLLDLKCMKKFVDIKGKHMAVIRDQDELEDEFISNNRARGLKEGRKDDLQSLGYLALFVLQGYLPWNMSNIVQVRSKLTLKQLCGKFQGLMEYMIVVAQMQTEDAPDYEKLIKCLSTI